MQRRLAHLRWAHPNRGKWSTNCRCVPEIVDVICSCILKVLAINCRHIYQKIVNVNWRCVLRHQWQMKILGVCTDICISQNIAGISPVLPSMSGWCTHRFTKLQTKGVGMFLLCSKPHPKMLTEPKMWVCAANLPALQNKLHRQKEKPLFCQALAAWWREGLLLMERFIPGIYRCTMALTNIHSGLICNASPDLGSYISLWIPFILHSVHSILCFFTHKAL